MKLYTVQHKSVLDKLLKNGFYKTDKRFICFKSFIPSYQWYVSEAKKRIKGWENDRPIWVWTKRPDLRQWNKTTGKSIQDREHVLLCIDVPKEQVLLSNFDLWHFVLNGHAIPEEGKRTGSMEKSWARCLYTSKKQLKPVIAKIGRISYQTQGIIEHITIDQLVSYKIFTVKTYLRK